MISNRRTKMLGYELITQLIDDRKIEPLRTLDAIRVSTGLDGLLIEELFVPPPPPKLVGNTFANLYRK